MVLSATSRSHDGGPIEAVDLGDPQAELVRDVGGDGGDGEVHVLEAHPLVQVQVEVLVRVDPAQLVEAGVPDGSGDDQVLVIAVAPLRGQQLRVHEVHPDLTHARFAGHHPEVTRARHVVGARVVRVDEVDELVLALVAAAVHAGHDLTTSPMTRPDRRVIFTDRFRNCQLLVILKC